MISINGKTIKEVYVGSNKISKVYHGSDLIWKAGEGGDPNIFDKSLADIYAYIRYANLSFNTATADNLMARCVVEPNTTYTVTLLMDTRFRIFSYNGQPATGTVLSGVIIDSSDTNGTASVNQTKTLSITTGSDHTMLYIGYWTSTGTMAAADIRNSIIITKN